MNGFAIFLILLSGFFHVIRDLFIKGARNKQVFLCIYLFVGFFITVPYSVYFLSKENFTLMNLGITFGSSIIHSFYLISLARAYEAGDFSHIYPIARSAPVLVLIFAVIFLHESVSLLGVFGILLVTFGVYMINAKSLSFKALAEPWHYMKSEPASRIAFLLMFIVAAYSLVDKIGVNFFHPITYFFLLQIFTFMFIAPYMFWKYKKEDFKMEWKNSKFNIIKASVFDVLTYTLALAALKIAQVSYVVSMRQFSVILAVFIGHHVLKERFAKVRITASIIIFCGLILISFA